MSRKVQLGGHQRAIPGPIPLDRPTTLVGTAGPCGETRLPEDIP